MPGLARKLSSSFRFLSRSRARKRCALIATVGLLVLVFHVALYRVLSTQTGNSSPGYIMYECDGSMDCGGWADRQKGIVAAYILSQMTRRRLALRVTIPCDIAIKLRPNVVDWRELPGYFSYFMAQTVRLLEEKSVAFATSLVDEDLDSRFEQPVVRLTSNMEWTQYLRQNKRFASRSPLLSDDQNIPISTLYKRALRELFTLTKPLKARLESFRKQISGRKLACAHVRLGVASKIPGEVKVITDIGEEGLRRLWAFLQDYAVPEYAIFVPSDSPDVSAEASRRFPRNIVSIPGEVVHVDKAKGSAACEGMDKVLLDQEALSLCDVIVVSRSGLGLIGSWLRPREDNTFCLVNSTIIPCHRDDFHVLFPDDTW